MKGFSGTAAKKLPTTGKGNVEAGGIPVSDRTAALCILFALCLVGGTPAQEAELHNAAKLGYVEKLRRLVNEGTDVDLLNAEGATALHVAVAAHQEGSTKALLDIGARPSIPDNRGRTPLSIAVSAQCWELVKLLTAHGAAPSSCHEAAACGDVEWLGVALAQGTEVDAQDSRGRTPLHWAALSGQLEVAAFLLNNGASADARDGDNRTPLHAAAVSGQFEMATLLLSQGANPNAEDGQHELPVHLAAAEGSTEIIDALIDAGCGVNVRNLFRWTPLHRAVLGGHIEVVRKLITAGADVDAQDAGGDTPLHKAVDRNLPEVVELLLDADAGKLIRNDEGEMPPEAAWRQEKFDMYWMFYPDLYRRLRAEDMRTISLSEYRQLHRGMTYKQVVEVVGGPGLAVEESGSGFNDTRVYWWPGDRKPYSSIAISFRFVRNRVGFLEAKAATR